MKRQLRALGRTLLSQISIAIVVGSVLVGCQTSPQTLEANEARSSSSQDGRQPSSHRSAAHTQAMLEQALFDTLVGAHKREAPLTEHTDRLIDQLARSVDRGAITARQERLWTALSVIHNDQALNQPLHIKDHAIAGWFEAVIKALEENISTSRTAASQLSTHDKLNLAWDAVLAQFTGNPFDLPYRGLPDLAIKPSLLDAKPLYFYQRVDHSIRLAEDKIALLHPDEMAPIALLLGLPGTHFITAMGGADVYFPSLAQANQRALSLAMLDAMNRLKLYGHHDLAEHRRRFLKIQFAQLHAALRLSEDIDPLLVRSAFRATSQLEEERLESEWQWVVQAQRELQQVARSYHWIATELLGESKTETWDARDYGRKLMRWAKRIDGPPALLDAN
ncbi:MAG: hypothetical protein CMQ23_05520 [Gammaproteobacteria bacterium]|nr:hypothetical protein [Gammaproteobacteria bacterium]